MIATGLLFPGQCIYSQVKDPKTKTELRITALVLATFSATISFAIPFSYTLSSFSASIILLGQYKAAHKELNKVPGFLIQRLVAISLSIIVGAKVGHKIREYRCPMPNPGQWYSSSWKTPFHLFNNLLVYGIFPLYRKELIDLKLIQAPGQHFHRHLSQYQTTRAKAIHAIAAFCLGALASYKISLAYTFCSVVALSLLSGACNASKGSPNDKTLFHFAGSLYLYLLGSKVGCVIAYFRFPPSSPWYSVTWKTPFHAANNLILIGAPTALILGALKLMKDPRPSLPVLKYEARRIEQKNKEEELSELQARINQLGDFKIDPEIISNDDKRAARLILLVGDDWDRESMKRNLNALNLLTHPDKSSGVNPALSPYVTEAGKIFNAISPIRQSD